MAQRLRYLAYSLMLAAGFSAAASAAELVMYESAGCSWCDAWHAEIGPVYPKTEEAARAPLRRVDLDGDPPQGITPDEPVNLTPTFLLVDDAGQEVGRITGYAGDELFWWQLGMLMEKLEE